MQNIGKFFRHALRRLIRVPLFTVTCVVTLALGIGANTAIFSVINGVLIKPLPFPDSERLVGVWHEAPGLGFDLVNQSPASYFTYRERNQVFDDIGIWDNNTASITGLEEPEEVETMMVTDGTLPLLGVAPSIGRRFSAEDDQGQSARTVMLSYGYWKERFGGDRGVIGSTLTIDGYPTEIIGVTPSGFRFLNYDPALFLPLRWDRSTVTTGNFSYQAIARLKEGVEIERASQDIARLIPLSVENFPGPVTLKMLEGAGFAPRIRPLKEDVVGDIGSVLWVLLGTVGIVFLIACANVANLFLVRAEGRHLEMAIRSALGASRLKVASEILAESCLLGVLGGVLGFLLAGGGLRLLKAIGPGTLPRLNEVAITPSTTLFTLALSVIAGLLFGFLPIRRLARSKVLSSLQDGSRGSSVGTGRQRARSVLAVAQVALALILLVGSGLMIRSFQALRKVDPGFHNPDQVISFQLYIPESEAAEPIRVARMHEEILQSIGAIPGVESVGLTSSVTMDGRDNNDPVFVEDFPTEEGALPPIRRIKNISPGYFETMQIPLLAGRSLDWSDIWETRQVVLITENLAREYWGDPGLAIGKRIMRGAPWISIGAWHEVVGVVQDVHDDGVALEAVKTTYWPILGPSQEGSGLDVQRFLAYAIRSDRVTTAGFQDSLRSAVWSVNANLPLANIRTLTELASNSISRTTFSLIMLAIAAAVALLLGSVGVYGVISYGVSLRTREIGVRMALGADRGDVSRLVLKRGLLLAGAGILAGVLVSVGMTRFMSAMLFGVDPLDPVTFVSVPVFLGLVALIASYLPARRASRLDPIDALR